ncbi:aminomethyl-transferring glycine dehydrogenase subunit GcvPA [soil metagenome]
MPSFVPHTDAELAVMLGDLGLSSLEALFAVVPEALRLQRHLDLAPGASEPDVNAELERLAAANVTGRDLVCFAGGGAYDHEVPAAVRAVAFRSEFVTAYTPYQPEVAQGLLQTLFEYQTVISRLAGLPVANASLYDGASSVVEAGNLAAATTGRSALWLSQGVNPRWREVARTFAAGTGHELVDLPLSGGTTAYVDVAKGASPPAAVIVQQPNYLGCLEDLGAARRTADEAGALLVVAVDPVAAGLLRTAGSQGADVVVGEGQPFGTPLGFGGPYLGLCACMSDHVRRLPGRLVGETVDVDCRRAYVTTLRTREQDIRREKATSNVCTNQTLIAVVCALQLAWLGTGGLRELALRCARATRYTREALIAIDGVEPLVEAPTLREFAVRLPGEPKVVVERMAEEGFLAGIPLEAEYGTSGLLVAATERRTRAEIEAYAGALEKVVR